MKGCLLRRQPFFYPHLQVIVKQGPVTVRRSQHGEVIVVVVVMPTAMVVVRLCVCRGRKEGDESA